MESFEIKISDSYIIPDPTGELYADLKDQAIEDGMKVRCLNLRDPEASCRYNPFKYIMTFEDAERLAVSIVDCAQSGAPAVKKDRMEKQLLTAAVSVISKFVPENERTLAFLIETLQSLDNGVFDSLIETIEGVDPADETVAAYRKYRAKAGRKYKNVANDCIDYLRGILRPEVSIFTASDTLDLTEAMTEPTLIFVIFPENDKSLDFIAAAAFKQLYVKAYDFALNCDGQRLKIHFNENEFNEIIPVLPKSSR